MPVMEEALWLVLQPWTTNTFAIMAWFPHEDSLLGEGESNYVLGIAGMDPGFQKG